MNKRKKLRKSPDLEYPAPSSYAKDGNYVSVPVVRLIRVGINGKMYDAIVQEKLLVNTHNVQETQSVIQEVSNVAAVNGQVYNYRGTEAWYIGTDHPAEFGVKIHGIDEPKTIKSSKRKR